MSFCALFPFADGDTREEVSEEKINNKTELEAQKHSYGNNFV